jgi:hypothetical protein
MEDELHFEDPLEMDASGDSGEDEEEPMEEAGGPVTLR